MKSKSRILYFLAILFAGIWGVGFFIYNAGNAIHVFFILSIIMFVLRIIRGKDTVV